MKDLMQSIENLFWLILSIFIFIVILLLAFFCISITTIILLAPIIFVVFFQNINFILLYVVFGVPILAYLFKNVY